MQYAAADVQHLHAMKDEWGSHIDLEDVIFIATERIKEVRTRCFSLSYPGCLVVCVSVHRDEEDRSVHCAL